MEFLHDKVKSPNRAQLCLRNKYTVFTKGGTVALRSVNKTFSGELQFYSYFPFGMSIAHIVYTKRLKIPKSLLRSLGIRFNYLLTRYSHNKSVNRKTERRLQTHRKSTRKPEFWDKLRKVGASAYCEFSKWCYRSKKALYYQNALREK